MDLSALAVPHTLARLEPLLPPSPARVLEAGCGRGALAAALADLGHRVTGVDRDADMAAAARERGVTVVEADIREVSGEHDVVLFTRSLHHADDLDGILAHARRLLVPGGRIIIEEFAWELVDEAAADFVYDNGALLVAAGLLDAEIAGEDLLDHWITGHEFLHEGSAMLDALGRVGSDLTDLRTAMLWRLVHGRGGTWTGPATRAADALDAVRRAEERRIATGTLPPIGILASVRR
ncbi:class I SAM-dependent methyltransferase [Saccharothrix sp. S26]|uniref:class I SAM-dependent methyltransferase n=1 Tax=Saccharothrix sp. S26 TaxID=2907215 RepID=UPI001F34621A|nr:methyltransferase domain-containing protein [Saccharothrix sp. S26]MCE6999237.1 class I SAM-dependent methyltransferase [Saccharothrix sp. S26]